jgi:hypothetical protein
MPTNIRRLFDYDDSECKSTISGIFGLLKKYINFNCDIYHFNNNIFIQLSNNLNIQYNLLTNNIRYNAINDSEDPEIQYDNESEEIRIDICISNIKQQYKIQNNIFTLQTFGYIINEWFLF